jgi:hypothetical protein
VTADEQEVEEIARELIREVDNIKTLLKNSLWNVRHQSDQSHLKTLLEQLVLRHKNEDKFSLNLRLMTNEIITKLAVNEDPQIRLMGDRYRALWKQALTSQMSHKP